MKTVSLLLHVIVFFILAIMKFTDLLSRPLKLKRQERRSGVEITLRQWKFVSKNWQQQGAKLSLG